MFDQNILSALFFPMFLFDPPENIKKSKIPFPLKNLVFL